MTARWSRRNRLVSRNEQVAVDTEHELIVAHEMTNSGLDRSQLADTAKQAQAVCKRRSWHPLPIADTSTGPEILECAEAGITVTLPKP